MNPKLANALTKAAFIYREATALEEPCRTKLIQRSREIFRQGVAAALLDDRSNMVARFLNDLEGVFHCESTEGCKD